LYHLCALLTCTMLALHVVHMCTHTVHAEVSTLHGVTTACATTHTKLWSACFFRWSHVPSRGIYSKHGAVCAPRHGVLFVHHMICSSAVCIDRTDGAHHTAALWQAYCAVLACWTSNNCRACGNTTCASTPAISHLTVHRPVAGVAGPGLGFKQP
jgi:hypothetical protein